jgi:two-component system sensor histidine kinase BarA
MVSGQSSFRRILLSRLLLVSVPILLMGVYVTYRKARSAFLEAARQNLTENADRQAQEISQAIAAIRFSLLAASNSQLLHDGTLKQQQSFIQKLNANLPSHITCLQLWSVQHQSLTANTCTFAPDYRVKPAFWTAHRQNFPLTPQDIYIRLLIPPPPDHPQSEQLNLALSAPIYDNRGQLQSILTFHAALLEREPLNPGSLQGYPVVIDQDGTILAHPYPQRVGRNIYQESDKQRLKSLMENAIAGRKDFLHLFAFEKNGLELVAGYSAIPSPMTVNNPKRWIVLAVSPLNAALAPLKDLQRVLLSLVLALLSVTVLAILFIARELAHPVEKLCDFALKKSKVDSKEPVPNNFRIREFHQLAIAIQMMVERLQDWGEEIVSSWQEANAANRLKSEFLATTSHELRTPLNGIIGCLRIVKDGLCDNPEEATEFLQQADDAAVHLLHIINDILDLARIESGKLSVTLETVDVVELLQGVVTLLKPSILEKGLDLSLTTDERHVLVEADPAKLKQVLLNVIGNSLKFTEKGKISIILALQDSSAGVWARVQVQDTGIGIEPRHQEKLFRPFVMVDGSTTRSFRGTGLGLAISRNLMALMGGTIELHSAGIGQGTSVEIALPLVAVKSALSTIATPATQEAI